MANRSTGVRRPRRARMMMCLFSSASFVGALSVAAMVRAEGSNGPELDETQSLTAATDLHVDIFDHENETFVWEGKSGVRLFGPAGTEIEGPSKITVITVDADGNTDSTTYDAFDSGDVMDPDENGVYRLDVLEDQFDRDANGNVILASRVPWGVEVLDKNDNEIRGRLFSREWRFDCGEFAQTSSTTGSFYARVPTGDDENWGVVELRLDGLAGYVFEIWGNHTGVNGPDAGRSVLEENNSVQNEYQMYLNPPDKKGTSYTHLTPEISNFTFIGGTDAGEANLLPGCNRIVAGDSKGQFMFETNVQGTYHIICDKNDDGEYDIVSKDDFLLLGPAQAGLNTVDWDGKDNNGKDFDIGRYRCKVRVTVGEFHYVGRDIETSFLGMRMYEVDQDGDHNPLNMFWNDELVQDWAVTMPSPYDYKAAETSGPSGVHSGDYSDDPVPVGESVNTDGNARSWGDFVTFQDSRGEGNGKGNRAFLDTYTWIAAKVSDFLRVRVVDGAPDTDGDGLSDFVERCVTGTSYDDPDSDDDSVGDEVETQGGEPGIDTDGDGANDGVDPDDDGDCVPTILEDPDGDGDPTNDDTDTDEVANYLDEDDDGDELQSCDEDVDGDGDPTNDDSDGDGTVNYLDPDDEDGPLGDLDEDGIVNQDDNCVTTPNTDQDDMDSDGMGDVCDDDVDGDGVLNVEDNCYIDNRLEIDPNDAVTDIDAANPGQTDINDDGIGDACQPDADGDGWPDVSDNCVDDANADQEDMDTDGEGDACDDDIDGDGLSNDKEEELGTDPRDPDTDGGGVSDGDEVDPDSSWGASDPLDPVDDPGPRQVTGGGLFHCAASPGPVETSWTPWLMLGILLALKQRNRKRRSNRTEG
jgi:hypothetical protein